MDQLDAHLYVDDRPAENIFRVHPAVYSDPELFELIDDVFRQSPYRYERYDKRKR